MPDESHRLVTSDQLPTSVGPVTDIQWGQPDHGVVGPCGLVGRGTGPKGSAYVKFIQTSIEEYDPDRRQDDEAEVRRIPGDSPDGEFFAYLAGDPPSRGRPPGRPDHLVALIEHLDGTGLEGEPVLLSPALVRTEGSGARLADPRWGFVDGTPISVMARRGAGSDASQYLAPEVRVDEVFHLQAAMRPAAKAYAIGAYLFRFLTGAPPSTDAAAELQGLPKRVRSKRSAELKLVARCLADRPEARPTLADLGQRLADTNLIWEQVSNERERSMPAVVKVVAAALLLGLLAVGGGAFHSLRRDFGALPFAGDPYVAAREAAETRRPVVSEEVQESIDALLGTDLIETAHQETADERERADEAERLLAEAEDRVEGETARAEQLERERDDAIAAAESLGVEHEGGLSQIAELQRSVQALELRNGELTDEIGRLSTYKGKVLADVRNVREGLEIDDEQLDRAISQRNRLLHDIFEMRRRQHENPAYLGLFDERPERWSAGSDAMRARFAELANERPAALAAERALLDRIPSERDALAWNDEDALETYREAFRLALDNAARDYRLAELAGEFAVSPGDSLLDATVEILRLEDWNALRIFRGERPVESVVRDIIVQIAPFDSDLWPEKDLGLQCGIGLYGHPVEIGRMYAAMLEGRDELKGPGDAPEFAIDAITLSGASVDPQQTAFVNDVRGILRGSSSPSDIRSQLESRESAELDALRLSGDTKAHWRFTRYFGEFQVDLVSGSLNFTKLHFLLTGDRVGGVRDPIRGRHLRLDSRYLYELFSARSESAARSVLSLDSYFRALSVRMPSREFDNPSGAPRFVKADLEGVVLDSGRELSDVGGFLLQASLDHRSNSALYYHDVVLSADGAPKIEFGPLPFDMSALTSASKEVKRAFLVMLSPPFAGQSDLDNLLRPGSLDDLYDVLVKHAELSRYFERRSDTVELRTERVWDFLLESTDAETKERYEAYREAWRAWVGPDYDIIEASAPRSGGR